MMTTLLHSSSKTKALVSQKFQIDHHYPVYFTESLFDNEAPGLWGILNDCGILPGSKLLFVIDDNVSAAHPDLIPLIEKKNGSHSYQLAGKSLVIPGGEIAKSDFSFVHKILEAVNQYGIDRHSYIICIGGGALLDATGFAAAIGHRGIRHVRIPTTVLSQNDSGVGVKNGINYFGKKNFIGTFSPPFAVINDASLLKTLSDRHFRCGIAEAIKVGLIKDGAFFNFIEQHHTALNRREDETVKQLIYRCAQIHLDHIGGADPFERGNSRPLDYGHWSAHKLEQLSNYRIFHGEAVIMGMCLDAAYAFLKGIFSMDELMRLVGLSKNLGFDIYAPEMEILDADSKNQMIRGLKEFREHLGGELTITLLEKIGKGIEVHEIDDETMVRAVTILREMNRNRRILSAHAG